MKVAIPDRLGDSRGLLVGWVIGDGPGNLGAGWVGGRR
jgi:hypothetical protein